MIEFKSKLEPSEVAKIVAAQLCPHSAIPPFYNESGEKWQLGSGNDHWLRVGHEVTDGAYQYRITWRAYAKVPDHISVPAEFFDFVRKS